MGVQSGCGMATFVIWKLQYTLLQTVFNILEVVQLHLWKELKSFVYKGLNGDGANLITTFILCAGGGMAGGMIS